MRRRLVSPALLLLSIFSGIGFFSNSCHGHNITKILSKNPDLSTFNHYLTATRLAADINRRNTITVLVVDNAAMAELLDHHFTLPTLRNVLELHVLVDYYGAKKLHQLTGGTALSASMFQSSGTATGTSGYVNISDHRAGHVTFSAVVDDADTATVPAVPTAASTFVKSIKEMPYNLSIIQISSPLSSPVAEAPTPAPPPINLTDAMSRQGVGCKRFADLLAATADVMATFDSNVDSGLTVFCPGDDAVAAFEPEFRNLSSEGKTSVLLYHAYPVYNSMQDLKSNNGLVPTLATDGTGRSYRLTVQNEGEKVELRTRIDTATITKTVLDQEPCAVYSIDKVLKPPELFKVAGDDGSAGPAPSPEPGKKTKTKKKKPDTADASPPPESDAAAPADDDKPADENAGTRCSFTGLRVSLVAAAAISYVF